MAAEGGGFLVEAATYLGAAAIAVPLFNRFKLGSILGYLVAGVIIGPSVLNLLDQEEGVFHAAELGVVLFLFLVGLELSLGRLWALRRNIFGLGAAQMIATGLAIGGLIYLTGFMALPASLVAGFSLAFSSTALALQYMKDRGELNSSYGARVFPILLLQDIAVVPLLAIVPFLASMPADGATMAGANDIAAEMSGWTDAAARGAAVIIAIFVVGRFALNPLLRLVAGSGSREAFAASALFIVAGVSLAVSWAGLSMALGALLAGVLLAESAYRHQIETDLEPFRGLLLGLFFISIGMRLNLSLIFDAWAIILGAAVGLTILKSAIVYVLVRVFGGDREDGLKAGAALSQGGEFAFVVFSLGVSSALFTDAQATLMSAIVPLSMIMTPFAMILARRLSQKDEEAKDQFETAPALEGHVLIGGFGRMGQIISQVVGSAGVKVVAIDRNPGHISNAERFGFKVYYGDASRLDVLVHAGALEASAVILTMDDPPSVNRAVEALRERAPLLTIVAVAHDRLHEIELRRLGPDVIVRETLESSLLIARETLARLNFAEPLIDDFVSQFRTRDRERLLAQMDYGPEAGMDLMHKGFDTKSDRKEDEKA